VINATIPQSKPVMIRVIILVMATAGLTDVPDAMERSEMPVSELIIESGRDHYVFRVEVASTPRLRERGLKNRNTLEQDASMLFLFTPAINVNMWMKDTRFPLDILFINGNGIITRIVEQAPPLSARLIPSGVEVSAVLEINGGMSARYGLRPGDRVIHPALGGYDRHAADPARGNISRDYAE
jgi:uncharacterized membrane protein (UPF0127 family)